MNITNEKIERAFLTLCVEKFNLTFADLAEKLNFRICSSDLDKEYKFKLNSEKDEKYYDYESIMNKFIEANNLANRLFDDGTITNEELDFLLFENKSSFLHYTSFYSFNLNVGILNLYETFLSLKDKYKDVSRDTFIKSLLFR